MTLPTLVCSDCGADNPTHATFCGVCGSRSLRVAKPTIYKPTVPTPPIDANPTKTKPVVTARRRVRVFIALGVLALLILAIFGAVTIHQNQVADVQATASAQALSTTQAGANAQASAIAQARVNNPCPSYVQECGSFSLALLDTLQTPGHWQNQNNTAFGGNCQFNKNAFQVSQTKPNSFFNCPGLDNFSNFVFEVQITSIQGDCGGMYVRYDPSTRQGYKFEICPTSATLGYQYDLTKYTGLSTAEATLLADGDNPSINSSGTNTLAIAFSSSSIVLYVNQKMVDSVNDSSLSNGVIGLIADDYSDSTIVTYNNARVWA